MNYASHMRLLKYEWALEVDGRLYGPLSFPRAMFIKDLGKLRPLVPPTADILRKIEFKIDADMNTP